MKCMQTMAKSQRSSRSGPNYLSAFSAVTGQAVANTSARARTFTAPNECVAEFIACCDAAIELAFDEPEAAVLIPGVGVKQARPTVNSYLLFVASEATNEEDPDRLANWYSRMTPGVWNCSGSPSGRRC
jgi:hypothetical protein